MSEFIIYYSNEAIYLVYLQYKKVHSYLQRG